MELQQKELVFWAMWWGWWLLQAGLYTLFAFLFLDAAYQFVIGFRGWWSARPLPEAKSFRRFAVLVPAHNEAAVLDGLMESLNLQEYPRDRFDVYVSCDNCSDNTAEVAAAHGAVALVRTDTTKNGKTWNVRWALQRIRLEEYDGLVMFDADNLADRDFLARMNDYMEAHPDAEAIQGCLDVKNPDDNWLTRAYALAYWYTNRFWQLARSKWELSCTLGGTGLVIRSATMRRLGWNMQSLTEDLELSTRLILSGKRVHWNDHARLFDEKPQSLKVSWRQRTRWMQGHYWVCWHYAFAALKRFAQTRRLQYLDLALYLMAPVKACVSLIVMISGMIYTIVNNAILFPTLGAKVPETVLEWAFFLSVPILMLLAYCTWVDVVGPSKRKGRLVLRYVTAVPAYFFYGMTWIPILFRAAFMAGSQAVWVKTEHTRKVSIDQVSARRTA